MIFSSSNTIKGAVKIYKDTGSKLILLSSSESNTSTIKATTNFSCLFSEALSGNDISKLIPTYVSLFTSDNKTCMLLPADLISKSYGYEPKELIYEDEYAEKTYREANYRAHILARIKKDNLISSYISAQKIVLLNGFGESWDYVMASIEFDDKEFIKTIFDSSNNIIVEWIVELDYLGED